ncbi:transcription factor ILR3-like isoform X2 [Raphanus sativus]|uniref:Transcription factor ILR3-like isoform X2 n=1 Tax=Raphanus sativus TaxID=3726 RepID=A0A6J0NZF3_RAPSA|nr:transcription factor ILR3-like isoform X2 [Raphanus sativus]XP_056848539.1 transcription factor ILR3-like isoform X2 [Raphanus sativus]
MNFVMLHAIDGDLIDADYESFTIQGPGFSWPLHQQPLAVSSNSSAGVDGSAGNSEASKEHGSKKRARCESSSATSSKACREKQCRDRLNVK